MTEHLDFWNYPDWGPEGTNNLRDPGRTPFWERPCKEPTPKAKIISVTPDVTYYLGPLDNTRVCSWRGQQVISCIHNITTDQYILGLKNGSKVALGIHDIVNMSGMENFNPIQGQLWFDTTTDKMMIYSLGRWAPLGNQHNDENSRRANMS